MEQYKSKIRTIGKVGRVLAMIFMILMIIATAVELIAGIVLVVIPQDYIRAEITADADVQITGSWSKDLPEDAKAQLERFVKEGTMPLISGMNVMEDKEGNARGVAAHLSMGAYTLTFKKLGLALLSAVLATGALIAVALTFCRLMKQIGSCDSPFSDAVVKAMTAFAISLIPYAVLKPIASSLSAAALLSGGSVTLSFRLDLTVVFVALVVLLLVMIFKYGVRLQKESDETL